MAPRINNKASLNNQGSLNNRGSLDNIASRRTGVNYHTHAIRFFRYNCCRVSISYRHSSIRKWWLFGSCPARNREAVRDSFGYLGDGVAQFFRPAVVAIRIVEGIDKHQQRFFEHANHSCKMEGMVMASHKGQAASSSKTGEVSVSLDKLNAIAESF